MPTSNSVVLNQFGFEGQLTGKETALYTELLLHTNQRRAPVCNTSVRLDMKGCKWIQVCVEECDNTFTPAERASLLGCLAKKGFYYPHEHADDSDWGWVKWAEFEVYFSFAW